eukprot:Skav213170  [mRNA]  locus=scaffold11:92037:98407:- [translate_table: standard]
MSNVTCSARSEQEAFRVRKERRSHHHHPHDQKVEGEEFSQDSYAGKFAPLITCPQEWVYLGGTIFAECILWCALCDPLVSAPADVDHPLDLRVSKIVKTSRTYQQLLRAVEVPVAMAQSGTLNCSTWRSLSSLWTHPSSVTMEDSPGGRRASKCMLSMRRPSASPKPAVD